MLCWRVSSGVSQPRSTRISATAVALFRSRMEPGPNRQISRTRTAGWGQRFTSQSSIFSVGEDWGAAGGTIGCSKGPLGIVSTCRSFSGSSMYRAKKLGPSPFGAIGISLDQSSETSIFMALSSVSIAAPGGKVDSNHKPFGLHWTVGTTADGGGCPQFFERFDFMPWV